MEQADEPRQDRCSERPSRVSARGVLALAALLLPWLLSYGCAEGDPPVTFGNIDVDTLTHEDLGRLLTYNPDFRVKNMAAGVLAASIEEGVESGEPVELDLLTRAPELFEHPRPPTRAAALLFLSYWFESDALAYASTEANPPALRPELAQALAYALPLRVDPRPDVKVALIRVLYHAADRRLAPADEAGVIEALRELAVDEDWSVQLEAIYALARFRDRAPDMIDEVARALSAHPDTLVSGTAGRMLAPGSP